MLLYIHVPFCARRCSYCDFAIAVRRETPSVAFAEAILAEWRMRQSEPAWTESPSVETVYFGGGTPSRLDPASLASILEGIRRDRPLAPDAEITLESNPDDVTPERAGAWRGLGVNRISLGVQSFAAPVLEWMHRTHTAAQVPDAMAALRAAGFANVSVDLIYGLPEELSRDWRGDLERAVALDPEHLSLYSLTVESGTALGKWTARGAVRAMPEDIVAEEYLAAHGVLARAGFEHYEVSNAARPGRRAVHNAGYWDRKPFVGLGPSAHSGFGRSRRWNLREWEAYRRAVAGGADPAHGVEELTGEQVTLERAYLGLRTVGGAPAELVPEPHAGRWIEAGWAVRDAGRLRLTPEGWLRLDALVASI